MTLNNYEWKENGEDEQGYFFVLTDTLHHLDYNVLLIKDNGQIMVNGDYINNVPHELAVAISPRIDYFRTLKNLKGYHHVHHEEKKAEPKKDEAKKPEKKEEKKTDKKDDKKKTDKKDKK